LFDIYEGVPLARYSIELKTEDDEDEDEEEEENKNIDSEKIPD